MRAARFCFTISRRRIPPPPKKLAREKYKRRSPKRGEIRCREKPYKSRHSQTATWRCAPGPFRPSTRRFAGRYSAICSTLKPVGADNFITDPTTPDYGARGGGLPGPHMCALNCQRAENARAGRPPRKISGPGVSARRASPLRGRLLARPTRRQSHVSDKTAAGSFSPAATSSQYVNIRAAGRKNPKELARKRRRIT